MILLINEADKWIPDQHRAVIIRTLDSVPITRYQIP